MWYFAWIFGLPFAAAFAVLHAMWLELMDDKAPARSCWPRQGNVMKAEPHRA